MKPIVRNLNDVYPEAQRESQLQRYRAAEVGFAEHFGELGNHRFFQLRDVPRYAETTRITTTEKYSRQA